MGKTVASLYRGVFGAASGAGIAIGTYFAFYGAACNVLSARTDMPASGIAFVSGGIAAVGSSVVKVPLAVCIRSVQAGVYLNVFAAARSITTAVGVRGLFTGFLPTLLEDVPDMAIKFAAYESMRQVQSRIRNGRPASPQEDFAMGAVAGSLAAAATTPLDVIKTNMMCTAASRPSMLGAVRMVYEQGGSAAFFRGIGPRALSNGINSAVFFAHPEFAVIGRSNVGKSSLINALTGNDKLAKVSKEPGATKLINHFLIDDGWCLVDLPGYGFSKTAGKAAREEWLSFTKDFFISRDALVHVLLLVDASLPPQAVDIDCANWLAECQVPFCIVFTKVDNRKKDLPTPAANIKAFKTMLAADWEALPWCFETSSRTGTGKAQLLGYLASLRQLHRQHQGQ
ncbi:EngB-type G domain-containing protein [Haematococcus lacustris]|uniref:EngB-type G domain-containing protein n=1 Tax=Haematococcus lacustris TaxID=44745 RepID=A0A699Y9R3_HAELA|nr:EngB-type G domain-containing protein [Haematococcus lacustris]